MRSGWLRLILSVFFVVVHAALPAPAQHRLSTSERPGRGVVALPNEDGTITVAWRLLASDPESVAFHVYRLNIYEGTEYERLTAQPLTESTTYVDEGARVARSYR